MKRFVYTWDEAFYLMQTKKKVQLKSKDNALLRPTLFCPAYQGISNKISTEQLMVVGTTVEETKAA